MTTFSWGVAITVEDPDVSTIDFPGIGWLWLAITAEDPDVYTIDSPGIRWLDK